MGKKGNDGTVKSVILKNGQIVQLTKWLNLPMHGEESRVRTRFLRVLGPLAKDHDDERIRLLSEYADKDKDGKPVMENNGLNYKLSEEAITKFRKVYEELEEADVQVDLLPAMVKDFHILKRVIENLNPPEGFTGETAELHALICEAFEQV